MQWLTAILAFATTMLIFAIVVTTLVETLHRALGSRSIGLATMLHHFYDKVLQDHIEKNTNFALNKNEFLNQMMHIRAPIKAPVKNEVNNNNENETQGILGFTDHTRWSFKLLTQLPTETFMERLGSTSFSAILKGKSGNYRDSLLKDIAQKYETFGNESRVHFEHKARLFSVVIAMFVAWVFYVHPYNLIQTYLKNPEVATNVIELADNAEEKYEELIEKATKLRENDPDRIVTTPISKKDLDDLIESLEMDIEAARGDVRNLADAGAPVGWPSENVCKLIVWEESFKIDNSCIAMPVEVEESPAKSQSDQKPVPFITIYYPNRSKDLFWLIMGGLLIGLGAPFWAKLISQLTRAKSISKNISDILQPQHQVQSDMTESLASTEKRNPVTTDAFLVAADTRESLIKDG